MLTGKAQAVEHLVYPIFIRITTCVLETGLEVIVALHKVFMQRALLLRRRCAQFVRKIAQFALPYSHLLEDREHLLAQGIFRLEIGCLRQVPDANIALARNGAFIWLFTTGQQVEQR